MNKKTVLLFGGCLLLAVPCFAQKNIVRVSKLFSSVERAAMQARFVPKYSLSSVVNGYLRTLGVLKFTVAGKSMRAVRFSRDIALKKEGLLVPKNSLAVVEPNGAISLYHPNEKLPAELEAGLASTEPELLVEMLPEEPEPVPAGWKGQSTYTAQEDLARDVDAFYGGKPVKTMRLRMTREEVKVYRLPVRWIEYHPVGSSATTLDSKSDLIVFFPNTQTGHILFGGLISDTWKIMYEELP